MPRPTAGIDWLLCNLNESGSGIGSVIIPAGFFFESSWGEVGGKKDVGKI